MSAPLDDAPATHRPASVRERVAVLGVGLLGSKAINWAFDYLLYPYVLWHLGLLYGGITMMLLSALACYLLLLFYDWTKKDWLGIEAIKDLKHSESQGRFLSLVGNFLRRSDWLAMLALSIKFDPFITVAYLRPGSYHFNGLTRREWGLFWVSVLISNLYWSFVAFTGITAFRWALEQLVP
ncbi:hypothetical protein [Immundisolibacter sp.]|uniref:hypothetical protein n=1 Tax=Immundisolibacter sp. TaxID=1934948 RepID=UPI0035618F5C